MDRLPIVNFLCRCNCTIAVAHNNIRRVETARIDPPFSICGALHLVVVAERSLDACILNLMRPRIVCRRIVSVRIFIHIAALDATVRSKARRTDTILLEYAAIQPVVERGCRDRRIHVCSIVRLADIGKVDRYRTRRHPSRIRHIPRKRKRIPTVRQRPLLRSIVGVQDTIIVRICAAQLHGVRDILRRRISVAIEHHIFPIGTGTLIVELRRITAHEPREADHTIAQDHILVAVRMSGDAVVDFLEEMCRRRQRGRGNRGSCYRCSGVVETL